MCVLHVFTCNKRKVHSWVPEVKKKTTIANICAIMVTNFISLGHHHQVVL